MVDPGGGTHEHRGAVFLGQGEGVPHHPVGLLHGGRVEHRELGVHGEGPGILLRLGGNGSGIVRHQHHHAALDADIAEAHKGVRRHVQPHLLHGHQGPHARPGRSGRRFQRRLLVHGPLHVHSAGIPLRGGLQNLRGRRAGIPRAESDARGQGSQRHGFIAHEKFSVHAPPPAAPFFLTAAAVLIFFLYKWYYSTKPPPMQRNGENPHKNTEKSAYPGFLRMILSLVQAARRSLCSLSPSGRRPDGPRCPPCPCSGR